MVKSKKDRDNHHAGDHKHEVEVKRLMKSYVKVGVSLRKIPLAFMTVKTR